MLRVSPRDPVPAFLKFAVYLQSLQPATTAAPADILQWFVSVITVIDPLKKVVLVTQTFFNYCVPFWKQTSGFCPCDYNIQDCDTCTTLDCQIREWISEALLMYPNIAKRKPQFTCLIWHCTFACCWLFSTFELKFEEGASAASFFAPDRLFLLEVSFVSCS